MKIAIICDYTDVHAYAVAWALRKLGYDADVVDVANPHDLARFQITISGDKAGAVTLDRIPIDVCWARKMRPIRVGDLIVAPNQVRHTAAELVEFRYNVLYCLSHSGVCRFVNRFASLMEGERKAVQLLIARQVGLNIPGTLISNDYVSVHNFIDSAQRAVVKPFLVHYWLDSEAKTRKAAITRRINANIVEKTPKEVFAAVPAIYQEEVDKVADVRVAVIGRSMFARRTEFTGQMVDTRFLKSPIVEQHHLPAGISEKLFELVKRIGLDVCSADFSLGRDGRYYFLELNPCGAMLMLESECGWPILKTLTEYVCGCDSHGDILYSDYQQTTDYDNFIENNRLVTDADRKGHGSAVVTFL